MVKKIVLHNISADEMLDIVEEVNDIGWVIGKDFDFEFCPSKWHTWGMEPYMNKHAIFTFYNEKLATFFALKYGNKST